ncbi:MAG: arginine--tRNA ligase [Deltaproteobacteria bacterium]|nr:arginine--tRNA ligase [Deltaproteobacteria bacterium]
MKSSITELFSHAVEKSFHGEHGLPSVFLERPKNKEHGDYALNIAMVLASKLKKNPREIAKTIIENVVDEDNIIKELGIAGPGFINITLSERYWQGILTNIYEAGERYGEGTIGNNEKVNIEFVSANPTGPLHVGHGRGAAVGDALARVLSAAGFDVTREYYWNDAGSQIRNLGVSINYRVREKRGIDSKGIPFPDYGYQGDYVEKVALTLIDESLLDFDKVGFLSDDELVDSSNPLALSSGFAASKILKSRIMGTLKSFGGIVFDVEQSEKELHEIGEVASAIDYLDKKGLIKVEAGAKWFKSSDFGDEKDRVVVKEDGSLTYLAADIAYHKKKLDGGFDRIIDVWGADHHGYIPRVKGAIEAMGSDPGKFDVLLIQMVTLTREGKPVPMSKRSGSFVTLNEVIEEVGSDAARFFFLMRRYDSQLEFDLELAKKSTADNPVFYVQYMHARICSILGHAKEASLEIPSPASVNLALLLEAEEIDIIKQLAAYPEVVEGSALSMEPHRLTIYLTNLAIAFHSYYNKTRIVVDDKELSRARLFMVCGVKTVVKNALALLGISAPEKM